MKVFITMDVYRDASQWRYLDRIVNKVADGWHIWQIEDPDSIEKTGWVEGSGREWIRELFEKAAIASSSGLLTSGKIRWHLDLAILLSGFTHKFICHKHVCAGIANLSNIEFIKKFGERCIRSLP